MPPRWPRRCRNTSSRPAPAPAAGPSAQERLKALDELRAQGLVNDVEFEIKRKQILEEL